MKYQVGADQPIRPQFREKVGAQTGPSGEHSRPLRGGCRAGMGAVVILGVPDSP
ncbi:hypothetical protein [Nitrosomonas communis]|uniref:hypothetical protein n=1 Tax=Nitrosomonas communis TaxID=44574 RepID=UPI0015A6C432|nr:hypothetical protein [Nitrosomonas communis]